MSPNLLSIVGANDNLVSLNKKTSTRNTYRLPVLDSRAFPQNFIIACTVRYGTVPGTYAVNFRQDLIMR
jgi:hypothetical protein